MKKLEWVLAGVLAVVMFASALNKTFSEESRGTLSDQLNVPGWFLILVSLFEIVLVVALVLPRFRVLGGVGVAVTMVGAAVISVFGETVDDQNPKLVIPLHIVLASLGLFTAWLAAGRPADVGTLISEARRQTLGQLEKV